MYTLASKSFQAAQWSGDTTRQIKIQLLDQNENVLQEILQRPQDGSVRVDASSTDIRRTFSLTLDNSDGRYKIGWPNGIWLNNRIKIFTGLSLAPGVVEYVPQGVFILQKPKASAPVGQYKISLQGSDKAALLNGDAGGKFADTYVIPNGINIATAIQTIAKLYGITNFNFVTCSYTVPYTMTFQPGDTAWKAIWQLAKAISWELFFDRNGFLVFRPQPDYTQLAPAISLNTIAAGANPYMGTELFFDDSGNYASNHIIVIGGSAQTSTVRAEAIDAATTSATSTVTLGQDRVRVVRDPIINTQALAQARANYELQNSVIAFEKQTITIVPNFLVDEEDVVNLNDPFVAVNKNYVIITMDIPLLWDHEMTIEAWEARNVISQNNLQVVNGS